MRGGCAVLQLRAKRLADAELLALARDLAALCRGLLEKTMGLPLLWPLLPGILDAVVRVWPMKGSLCAAARLARPAAATIARRIRSVVIDGFLYTWKQTRRID